MEHTRYRQTRELNVLGDEAAASEPVVVRKAMALALLLDETPPIIMEDELIVGLRTIYGPLEAGRNVVGSDYELPVKPATDHSLTFYPHYLKEQELAETRRLGIREGQATGHVPFGTARVLRHGYAGIKNEALQTAQQLRADPKTDRGRTDFLRAVTIVMDAASRFASKHADEAEHLAKMASEPVRREELTRIAEACRWVSSNPPRTFHEALQLFWFTAVVIKAEDQACLPIGRFDQDLIPYYRRDLEENGLTREAALELLECVWIKLNIEDDLTTDTCENITLSGQDAEGDDVTNELTYLCLDASMDLGLTDPKINVRFHEGSPPELWDKCLRMVKMGMGGFPAFYNDEAIIPNIMKAGIPFRDARLYSCDGCQEVIIPGKGDFYPTFTSVDLLGTVLNVLARSDDFKDFGEFMKGYGKELSTAVKNAVEDGNTRDSALARLSPVPFLSSTLEGCTENGLDKTQGGTIYNYTACLGRPFANAVNSLAALKKLVYDDRVVSALLLRDILAKDWEGHERLRQLALNRVPKYGNDDDYVDSIAVQVGGQFFEEVLKYRNPRGGRYYPGIFTFQHMAVGKKVGATPDGRRAGDTASSHASPAVGTDLSGPTAVVNSALKLCKLGPPEGTALDVRFHPSALQGEAGTENLLSFIKAYMEEGGIEIQFNVVDSETLREAQRHPENYKDLIVRVWGFSAYFVTLTKDYQENVIARTEHGF